MILNRTIELLIDTKNELTLIKCQRFQEKHCNFQKAHDSTVVEKSLDPG